MMRVTMFPASYGDCILLEYGDATSPYRILIDGGLAKTPGFLVERFRDQLPLQIDLLVVTHIDADHIAGVLSLFSKYRRQFDIKQIWFNGYRQLPGAQPLGVEQAEELSRRLEELNIPWNRCFNCDAVAVGPEIPRTPKQPGKPPRVKLPDASIIILSPTFDQLKRLRAKWEAVLRELEERLAETEECENSKGDDKYGVPLGGDGAEEPPEELALKRFVEDTAPANGSSIAFVFTHNGRRVLFGADAHPSTLLQSLRLVWPFGPIRLDAFKLAHHGSKSNLSPELLEAIACRRFLVSTNGKRFNHPDAQAIARIVARKIEGCELYFNYESDQTVRWRGYQDSYGFKALYGTQLGISVDL